MKEKDPGLVYHSQHRRHLSGGCMPLFLLAALAFVGVLFALVRVEMKPPMRPAGAGDVLYRTDDMLEPQIRQRSPLPLRLPRYVAPLRMDEGVVNLPLRRKLKAAEAPEELPFPSAPDSVVLNTTTLLELPPVKNEAASAGAEPAASPVASPAAAPAAAPAPINPVPVTLPYVEPASAELRGREVA